MHFTNTILSPLILALAASALFVPRTPAPAADLTVLEAHAAEALVPRFFFGFGRRPAASAQDQPAPPPKSPEQQAQEDAELQKAIAEEFINNPPVIGSS
ncbi:MAG: hypothetical protein M1832_002940 [Thelocarpon impressellum]|nr:MAG: hypothetical protein M1832_002940 [Thelocarpon impressellum]